MSKLKRKINPSTQLPLRLAALQATEACETVTIEAPLLAGIAQSCWILHSFSSTIFLLVLARREPARSRSEVNDQFIFNYPTRSKPSLACISHRCSTASAESSVLTVLRSVGLLDGCRGEAVPRPNWIVGSGSTSRGFCLRLGSGRPPADPYRRPRGLGRDALSGRPFRRFVTSGDEK